MAAGLARSNPGGYLLVLLPCIYVLLPDLLGPIPIYSSCVLVLLLLTGSGFQLGLL